MPCAYFEFPQYFSFCACLAIQRVKSFFSDISSIFFTIGQAVQADQHHVLAIGCNFFWRRFLLWRQFLRWRRGNTHMTLMFLCPNRRVKKKKWNKDEWDPCFGRILYMQVSSSALFCLSSLTSISVCIHAQYVNSNVNQQSVECMLLHNNHFECLCIFCMLFWCRACCQQNTPSTETGHIVLHILHIFLRINDSIVSAYYFAFLSHTVAHFLWILLCT